MTRPEFDALLAEAVRRMAAGAADGAPGQDAALDEAWLLDAEAREFADAVDRSNHAGAYGSVVLVEGGGHQLVAWASDYARRPAAWAALVGGEPERIVEGPRLMETLARAVRPAHL